MTEAERMVVDCIKNEREFNLDEMRFIDAMECTLRAGAALTYAQAERLRDLWKTIPW